MIFTTAISLLLLDPARVASPPLPRSARRAAKGWLSPVPPPPPHRSRPRTARSPPPRRLPRLHWRSSSPPNKPSQRTTPSDLSREPPLTAAPRGAAPARSPPAPSPRPV